MILCFSHVQSLLIYGDVLAMDPLVAYLALRIGQRVLS